MSIWHKPDEKPIQHRWIVVKYRAPVKPSCKFVEKDTYISPVCDYAYVNDLVQDYNRTRKALDVAIEYIKHTQRVDPFWFNRLANKTLAEIKTALEQKDGSNE